jgi:hypothetical protein
MTMEYDKDKVDEATLALLYLGMSRTPGGGRAWKGFDLQTLARLHQKGWIGEPKIKDISVAVTADGVKKAEELVKNYFQSPRNGGSAPT